MKAQKKISKVQPKKVVPSKVAKAVKVIPKKEAKPKALSKAEKLSAEGNKIFVEKHNMALDKHTRKMQKSLEKKQDIPESYTVTRPIPPAIKETPAPVETPRLPQYINDEQRRHQEWLKNNKPG